jgi:hypothetical protein
VVSETNFLKFAEECFEDIDCNTLDTFIYEEFSRAPLQISESVMAHYINSDPIVKQFVRSCGRREVIDQRGQNKSNKFRLTPATRRNYVAVESINQEQEQQEIHEQQIEEHQQEGQQYTAEGSGDKLASLAKFEMNLKHLSQLSNSKLYLCYFHF